MGSNPTGSTIVIEVKKQVQRLYHSPFLSYFSATAAPNAAQALSIWANSASVFIAPQLRAAGVDGQADDRRPAAVTGHPLHPGHAIEGIKIEDVARGVKTSGKTLQKRYRAHFRESVKDEILRVQIERAKRLLVETDMKVIDIGLACGFKHCGRFSGTFHRIAGHPPEQYRQRKRPR